MRPLWIAPLFVCLCAGQTLTLESALDLAARQNPGVQVARLRALEREAQAVSTKADYLPQANIVIGGTYQTQNLQGIGLAFPGINSFKPCFTMYSRAAGIRSSSLRFSCLKVTGGCAKRM